MSVPKNQVLGWLTRYAATLRFPNLLALIAGLFFLDLLVPDLIPFADEIFLGLMTLLLASLRRRAPRETAAGGRIVDAEAIPEPDSDDRGSV